MLWFTAPNWSSGILYLALALLVVGRTGEAWAENILEHYIRLGNNNEIAVKKVEDRIDVWCSIARCPGAILGLWISDLEPKSTFKILAIVTIIGYVFLICGILYRQCQNNERNPRETPNQSQNLNPGETPNQSHDGIKQVMPKLLLLYTPFLIHYVVQGAGKTFFYEQADVLNDHIGKIFFHPWSTLYAIQKGAGLMTKLLMEILTITKWKGSEEWQCAKLILGMFVCFCCCKCSWYFEYFRRLVSEQSLNNLWMVPQFVLLGIAKELVEDGMKDVFFSHLNDKSMHEWVFTFLFFVEGLGALFGEGFIAVLGKWIRDDIHDSRLDKYYFLLAMLTVLAIIFFMCLLKFYAPKIKRNEAEPTSGGSDQRLVGLSGRSLVPLNNISSSNLVNEETDTGRVSSQMGSDAV